VRISGAIEGEEVVAIIGTTPAYANIELPVQGDVVVVAVGVQWLLADPLAILLVGEGLEGPNGPVELAGGATALELRLVVLVGGP
jgi:hypothetical protein